MEISLDDFLKQIKTSFENGYTAAIRAERGESFLDLFCGYMAGAANLHCRFVLSNMLNDKLIPDEVFYEKIKMFPH